MCVRDVASLLARLYPSNLNLSTVFTVSPIGLNHNNPGGVVALNNGADFGPDTPSTSTGGLQEALAAISGGGTVVDIGGGGAAYPYYLTESVLGTGSGQTLIFNPGSCIQLVFNDSSSFNAYGALQPCTNGNSTSPANYSRVRWLGNGVTVNGGNPTNQMANPNCIMYIGGIQPNYNASDPPTYGTVPGSRDVLVDGFQFTNVGVATTVFCGGSMAGSSWGGTNPPIDSCLRSTVVRRLYASNSTGSDTALDQACFWMTGAAHYIRIEDSVFDQSGQPNLSQPVSCFVRSNHGATSNVTFDRCYVAAASNSNSAEAFEFQGGDNAAQAANSSPNWAITQFIAVRDCWANTGFTFVDDDFGASSLQIYVNCIEFLRTRFYNNLSAPVTAAIEFGSSSTGPFPFGYVRFTDCDLSAFAAGGWSSFATSSLTARSPGSAVSLNSVFSSSGFTYYNVDGNDEVIVVDNTGSGVSVMINAVQVSNTSGAFFLRTGHFIKVSWGSTKPNIYKFSL